MSNRLRVPGKHWCLKGELDKAIADYSEAIRLDPKDPQAFADRGTAWISAGEPDKAMADFNEVVRLNPKDPSTYIARADVEHQGYARQGHGWLGRGHSAGSERPSAFVARSVFWLVSGQRVKAIADINEAIRLDPKDPVGYSLRGGLWSHTGDYDKAIADYTEAIRLNPKEPSYYMGRGGAWLLTKKSNLDKTIADYSEAIRLDPKQPSATPTGVVCGG